MKKYTIHIKGNIPAIIRDSVYFNREYSDLTYEYGFINYKGTDEQLDGLLEYLTLKGEAEFKIIGVYEDNAEEEEYYKNLHDINTFSCSDNEVYLSGTDEEGKDFTIVLNAFELLEWLDMKYIKEQTLKYIDKL